MAAPRRSTLATLYLQILTPFHQILSLFFVEVNRFSAEHYSTTSYPWSAVTFVISELTLCELYRFEVWFLLLFLLLSTFFLFIQRKNYRTLMCFFDDNLFVCNDTLSTDVLGAFTFRNVNNNYSMKSGVE